MPRHPYETEINAETSEAALHECIIAAVHTSDSNARRAAAEATVELARRERVKWRERFETESQERRKQLDMESRERVNAQQFQEAQTNRQLKIAVTQSRTARFAAWATALVALATIALATLEVIRFFAADPARTSATPPATEQLKSE